MFFVALVLLHQTMSVVGGSASSISPGNLTTISEDDMRRLTFVKLGVAVGMFTVTAIACGFPLLIMTCITKRDRSRGNVTAANFPGGSSPDYASSSLVSHNAVQDDPEASLPTLLLDSPGAESEELLLNRGNDSHLPDISRESNRGPFYEVVSRDGSPTSMAAPRENDRLHWENSAGNLEAEVRDNDAVNSAAGGHGATSSFPVKMPQRHESRRRLCMIRKWASRINCFAAGIFLTTGLMDLFPEVQDAMALALSSLKINSDYPFSALCTLIGFFLVLSVEQSLHVCYSQRRRRHGSTAATEPASLNHSHNVILNYGNDGNASTFFRIMLLLIALSVHSVFEGLAVGLQRSISEVVTLFSALLLHKVIMAASIGVSLATARQQRGGIVKSQWIGALVFSFASPLGVLIGWALIAQQSSPTLLMAIAVLQGLACGTFFFVVFCEMLPHELGEDTGLVRDRLGKMISLVLGFALVAGYIAFEPK
ncbi:unnamed protein product [Mesocestoides corti]|nr:unnamed protein product [Mesocestoides corti]